MEEKDYNQIDETVIFKPITEEDSKEITKSHDITPEEIFEYDLPKKESPEDDYEEDDERDKNNTLIIVAILAGIVFLATAIWGVCMLLADEKEPPQEEEIVEIIEKEEEIVEEEEEVVEEEVATSSYNIIFLTDSVEKEGTSFTVRAKLFNNRMLSEGEKRIALTRDTQIIEDGSQLSVVSFVSVIESLADGVVFQAEINDETREVVTISYFSSILKKKEVPPAEVPAEPEVKEEEKPPAEISPREEQQAPSTEKEVTKVDGI